MVTFEFYQTIFTGQLDEQTFLRLLPSAKKLFNNYTNNRVTVDTEITDDFKHCICELIDLNYEIDQSGNISSTSDGVTSVSYNTNATPVIRRNEVLNKWLDGYYDLTFGGF